MGLIFQMLWPAHSPLWGSLLDGQADGQMDKTGTRNTDEDLDRTYMGTSQVSYSNSRHADRECRLRAAEDSTCPAQESREWVTGHRRADCAGHSREFRWDYSNIRDRIHSIRRQLVRHMHRRSELQWPHSASSCCSRPSSCWHSAGERPPDRRWGTGSTGRRVCPGRRTADTCPAARSASRSRRWCT